MDVAKTADQEVRQKLENVMTIERMFSAETNALDLRRQPKSSP